MLQNIHVYILYACKHLEAPVVNDMKLKWFYGCTGSACMQIRGDKELLW
jgi:hypothetical protein